MQKPISRKQRIIWPDNTCYFLTTSTFLHYPYFDRSEQKQIVLNKIMQAKHSLEISVQAFSISINHFHVKFHAKEGNKVTKLKTILHGGISREYKKIYKVPYKEFWHSTRTYYIKDDEETSWKITGYNIGNLLKHKEVSTFKELKNNPFSSYKYTANKFGEKVAQELVRSVIDVNEDKEGNVDIEELKNINVKDCPWKK